ncbi:hypothetical protein BJ944DRAFT_156255, partial [Cunninghamella echinulata]
LASRSQVVEFINEVYSPYGPKNNESYEFKSVTTNDVFELVKSSSNFFEGRSSSRVIRPGAVTTVCFFFFFLQAKASRKKNKSDTNIIGAEFIKLIIKIKKNEENVVKL